VELYYSRDELNYNLLFENQVSFYSAIIIGKELIYNRVDKKQTVVRKHSTCIRSHFFLESNKTWIHKNVKHIWHYYVYINSSRMNQFIINF